MSEKKKLTLSINSEVIEKAKELGLNLSEINTSSSLK
ncbi:MAG: type II toxin-antitoxin system CcdA family antitoxin [Proteobacteria bacterium]|nr:type II toxin-antitoxin system CcdA family antitoxin [Pseudomonadota bacterium]